MLHMIQFMKNKIIIPLFIIGALVAFFSFKYAASRDALTDSKRGLILRSVVTAIREGHYAPRAVDDSLSAKVYNKMLENLDYDKKFFTQEDIDVLSKYKYAIDNEISAGSVVFYDTLNSIFSKRVDQAESLYKELLDRPFSFAGNETIQLNGEKLAYVKDDAALKKRWYTYLKYRVLARYVDMKRDQDSSKDKSIKKKTDAEIEVAAREAIRKNQDIFFKRLRKIKDDDRFALYVNSITSAHDPHTDFFPPLDKARFDEQMSGSFIGIGAQLREEEGKIKVAAIVTGSPSWRQGELKAGDEIQKVAQGADDPVDIQGWEIDEVVKIIRGKKGTEVRLTVKKLDGSQKVINIMRGEVLLEEVFAKSAIIRTDNGPIGYIYLPEFYADFNKRDGRRCAVDVAKELEKLKDEHVAGVILDLRGNGGGSLSDVVDIAGMFIDQGPIVQVKSSGAAPQMQTDRYNGTLYDGPFAIMVNQGSASASEIMAAAMQDYGRAIVVGTPTFGKGTVQRVISLDDMIPVADRLALREKGILSGDENIGSLKITMQKFYRINGGSTQLRGVTPDIVLPDPYRYIDIGERRDKSALPWDEIAPARYQKVANAVNVPLLQAASKKRTDANQTFSLIDQNAHRLKQQEDENVYVLNELAYRKKLDEANALSKKVDELENKAPQLTLENPKVDLPKINLDSSNIAKNEGWLKALRKDIYLSETVNIMADMMRGNGKVNMGTGMK